MPIAGDVQTPIDTISVCDLYYDQPVNGCTSRAGKVTDDLTQLYENQSYTIGKALVDPGCQEHLSQSIYESYMNETSQSNLSVSGFDGSQQPRGVPTLVNAYIQPKHTRTCVLDPVCNCLCD